MVTVIGGQGHIFGRGNQQLSAAVIRRVGPEHVIVIASETKLLSLAGGPLLVDSGEAELDAAFAGYRQVVTSLGRRTMYRVEAASPPGRLALGAQAGERGADHRLDHGERPVDVEVRVERGLQADAVLDGDEHRADGGELAAPLVAHLRGAPSSDSTGSLTPVISRTSSR